MLGRISSCWSVALVACSVAAVPAFAEVSVVYDEAVSGDIATPGPDGTPESGTVIELGLGENWVFGTQEWSGIAGGSFQDRIIDFDSFRFVLPAGTQLNAVQVTLMATESQSVEDGGLGACRLTDSRLLQQGQVTLAQQGQNANDPCASFLSGPVSLWSDVLPLGSGTYGWNPALFLRFGGIPIGTPYVARWAYQIAFQIERLDPVAATENLIANIEGLGLNSGLSTALGAPLRNSLGAMAPAASNMLAAFIEMIEAQRGKSLSEADADALVRAARDIIAALAAS